MTTNNKISLWMKLRRAIAAFGTNPNDVAAAAHALTGYAILTLWPSWIAFFSLAAVFGFKEFYLDARDETPHQTFLDNLSDWAEYIAGGLLGAWKMGLF